MGEAHVCIFEQMLISTCRATSVPFCSFLFFFVLGCLLVWVILCTLMAGLGLIEALTALLRCFFIPIRGVYKMARKAVKSAAKRKAVEAAVDKVVLVACECPAVDV